MKYILTLLILLPLFSIGQKLVLLQNCESPIWDSTKYKSICGLKANCIVPCLHYIPIKKKENDGNPVYGPQGSLIGLINGKLFIKTDIRNHLTGKPLDRKLLENDTLLISYLKLNYNL